MNEAIAEACVLWLIMDEAETPETAAMARALTVVTPTYVPLVMQYQRRSMPSSTTAVRGPVGTTRYKVSTTQGPVVRKTRGAGAATVAVAVAGVTTGLEAAADEYLSRKKISNEYGNEESEFYLFLRWWPPLRHWMLRYSGLE